jgi:hypothetical protein
MGNSSSKSGFALIVQRLSTEDLDAADQEFWDQLWKTPLDVEVDQCASVIQWHHIIFHLPASCLLSLTYEPTSCCAFSRELTAGNL